MKYKTGDLVEIKNIGKESHPKFSATGEILFNQKYSNSKIDLFVCEKEIGIILHTISEKSFFNIDGGSGKWNGYWIYMPQLQEYELLFELELKKVE